MDKNILEKLIALSALAEVEDEVPIAALIVYEGKIISTGYNSRNKSHITTDHAEIKAINGANLVLNDWRLNKCSLYVTIEPCDMCKGVIRESRIDNIYYLLPRLEHKKQYNKGVFKQYLSTSTEEEELIEKYRKKLEYFWKNKR